MLKWHHHWVICAGMTHLHTRNTLHARNTPTHRGHIYTPGTHLHGTHLHTYTGHTYTPEQWLCELNSVFLGLKIVHVCELNCVWTKKCVCCELQCHVFSVD